MPACDLLTYSFPCQDLSITGDRKGMGEGTRSGLVWEVLRLLEKDVDRPEWLLMENVPLVFSAPEWPELVQRLSTMGYRNKWQLIDSSRFGSAQKRIRAFMVSRLNADPPDLPTSVPNAPSLCLKDIMEPTREEKFIRRIPLDMVTFRDGNVEPGISTPQAEIEGIGDMYFKKSIYSSSSSPTITKVNQGIMVCSDSEERCDSLTVNVLTPLECWRLMGQPYWAFKRASEVCSDTQLYNLAGNSIVVEVLMAIFSAMFGTKGARTEQSTLMRWGVTA